MAASSVQTVLRTPCSGLLPLRVLELLSMEMHMKRYEIYSMQLQRWASCCRPVSEQSRGCALASPGSEETVVSFWFSLSFSPQVYSDQMTVHEQVAATGSHVTGSGLWMPRRTQEILTALGSSHLQRALQRSLGLYPRDPCFSLSVLLCPEYDLHCVDCSPCSLLMRRKHWWGRGNTPCRQRLVGGGT